MRNSLPKSGPHVNKCAVVNLDDNSGSGTHWVAYRKKDNQIVYFDSIGDLRPPLDLIQYFNADKIAYNYMKYQNFNTYICGHLCLKFLCNLLEHNDNYHLHK